MLQNVTFHHDLHCLLRYKTSSGTNILHFIEISPYNLEMQNRLFHSYCIDMSGIIHQNEKKYPLCDKVTCKERSGSVVECWTRNREAAGSNLTGVTALCA